MRSTAIPVLFVALAALAASPASLADAAKDFSRAWQEAGTDENKKRDAIDRLAKDRSDEVAKLLIAVALMPNESGSVTDHAVARLSELEGTEADVWMREQLRQGGRWADRVIIARAIGRRATIDAQRVLLGLLPDKSWQVEAAALDALKHHRTPEVVSALLDFWSKLDPKKEETARLAGDIRDTVVVITGKDFQTAADARSWWSANEKGWKPQKRAGELIETKESVTQERAPRLFDEIASRRVILVVDTSASMRVETGAGKDAKNPQGLSRFEVMRREVKRVIEDLPQGTTFNVVSFSSKVLPWKDRLVQATETNKKGAVRFVDLLREPDGETNSFGALEQAFKNPDADTIYFLSDGYPTVGKIDFNSILAEVKKWNATRAMKIHTIAFVAGNGKPLGIEEGDKSLPKEFMRRLAQENGGRYKLVE